MDKPILFEAIDSENKNSHSLVHAPDQQNNDLVQQYNQLQNQQIGKPIKRRFLRKRTSIGKKDPFELVGPRHEVKKALGLVRAYGEGFEYSRLTKKIMKVQLKEDKKVEQKKLKY